MLDKLRSVGFSSTHWRELGQRITPTTDVDAIEDSHPKNPHRCLEEIIDEWKRKGQSPTWETLAGAVSQCKGGGPNVGKELLIKVGVGMLLFQSAVITIECMCVVAAGYVVEPNIHDGPTTYGGVQALENISNSFYIHFL